VASRCSPSNRIPTGTRHCNFESLVTIYIYICLRANHICFVLFSDRFKNGLFPSFTPNNDIDSDLAEVMKSLGIEESNDAALSRTVTLEPSIVVEKETDFSTDHYRSRSSLENHTSARDLMIHMHGLTPVRKEVTKPPRLSLQSMSSAGTACNYYAASPFSTAPMSAIGKSNYTNCLTPHFVET
jgi:hypothetical protein